MSPTSIGLYAGAEKHVPRGVMPGQRVAEPGPDGVVVFLVGMRVNRWRRLRSWFPVFVAMPRMLRELSDDEEAGLLSVRTYWSGRVFMTVQYWRSPEHLGRYARNADGKHAPACARWNKSGGPRSGDVGLFHETYLVPSSNIETRYSNMAPLGLAEAGPSVSRAQRTRRTRADDLVEGNVGH